MPDRRQRVIDQVLDALGHDRFVKLTLATPTDASEVRRVLGRRVELTAGPHLQLTLRLPTRDEVVNAPLGEVADHLETWIGPRMRSANLFTTEADHQLQWRKDAWVLSRSRPTHTAVPSSQHDRTKQRAVELDSRWLEGLSVLGPQGKVRRGMQRKHQQILRFIEIIDHALRDVVTPGRRIRLVDMGCGKGFLTFAAWQWLAARDAVAEVVGVERRQKLVAQSEGLARRLGLEGLRFIAGTIADAPLSEVDVVVALHACDTATDDAIAKAVQAGAEVVLVAPCCHQEVRPQITGPQALDEVLRHGILRTRTAEMVTDALRAALLETEGFRTRIFEFVDADHTDKNLMIAAHRRGDPATGDRLDAPRTLARTYGIERQRLADLLGYSLVVTDG
ncbi:MAG: SAM-dependent methyltransferase [Myxococcota bacterium]